MNTVFETRLSQLERRHRLLAALFALVVPCLLGVAAYQAYALHQVRTATSLRLHELRIYDANGADRVVLSGRLPQPLRDGKPYATRPRAMAGMLIYDASRTERGGYGTMDDYANAMLTLDAKDHQVMLMLAEPGGGAFFRQWEGAGSVTMGSDGRPFLTVKDGQDVVFAKPENNPWVARGMK